MRRAIYKGMRRWLVGPVLWTAVSLAASPVLERARDLYRHTDYNGVLSLLARQPNKQASEFALLGQAHFMLGDFHKASDTLEQAVALDPGNSDYELWLGRAFGRRAETSSFISAPGLASKARQHFEKAVQLDSRNLEAANDLFEYYLEAPGFLGGGLDKAQALAQRIGQLDPAESHYALARLAEKRKEFQTAEQQLRRAMDLAPRQVGRIIDLAKFLSKQGRYQESEDVFKQAEKVDPNSPKLLFAKASTYIRAGRNLDQARDLLRRYLEMPLSPDDPPRQEAQALLKQASSS